MDNPIIVIKFLLISRELRSSGFQFLSPFISASLTAQLVTDPPAMQETPIRSLGQKHPLEKGKASHSSILVWRIPWTV